MKFFQTISGTLGVFPQLFFIPVGFEVWVWVGNGIANPKAGHSDPWVKHGETGLMTTGRNFNLEMMPIYLHMVLN